MGISKIHSVRVRFSPFNEPGTLDEAFKCDFVGWEECPTARLWLCQCIRERELSHAFGIEDNKKCLCS